MISNLLRTVKTRLGYLIVLFGLLIQYSSAFGQHIEVSNGTEKIPVIVFGNAPEYIDLSESTTYLVDFPSKWSSDNFYVFKLNEDTIALDSLQPVVVTIPVSGEMVFALISADGKAHKMNVDVIKKAPLVKNDAVVLGLLLLCLAFVFYTSTSENKGLKKFYSVVPALLMCYLLPSILASLGIVNSVESSGIYYIATRYLLPTALVLMTLSIDLKGIVNLGPKSIIMFLTGTVGIILGGPLAILIVSTFSPETVGGQGPEAVWRGLSTLAGSWIGGGANQTAMLEVYGYSQSKYGGMVLVDIVVANIWMAVLLYGAGKADKIDKWLKADSSAIKELQVKMETFTKSITINPSLRDILVVLGVAFGATAFSHLSGKWFTTFFSGFDALKGSTLTSSFFWLVVMATTIGLVLSFTKARRLEAYGASKFGSVFIYVLVATIGMKMDLRQILENPLLIVVGLIWMAFHAGLLLFVAKMIRAPFFFMAVGSKANVGGAASAPVVAAAFHPSLAPVGVLLAVLGYAIGTYGAWLCAVLMEGVAP
jgi:uncharacterized membrane protein